MPSCANCGKPNRQCECEDDRSRSHERREKERDQRGRRPEEEQEALLERIADKAATKAAEMAAEKVCQRAVEMAVHVIDEKYGPKFQSMEAEFKKLQTSILQSGGGANGTSFPSSRPGASSFLRNNRNFIAEKVWIKGYIQDWKKKDDTSLTKPTVMEWVKTMHGEMNENIKDHIDLSATEKYANKVLFTKFAIRLKNVTDREIAWTVKNEIERLWSSNKGLINGLTPRVVVEPSPEMKPYIDAGGKCMGALQAKGVHKSSVRPEWGPPVKIFDNRQADRPVCVAEFDGVVGWTIHEAALQALSPGSSAEDFKTTLNA